MSDQGQLRWTAAADAHARAVGGMGALGWSLLIALFAAFYAGYFAPALLQQSLLAPGDGEIYYLPFFGLPVGEWWNDLILSGYPVALDIQAMTLYPLRWLSPSFNSLVVSAYVVAAVGMFGLCLRLTGSRLGALTAAFIVSGSGFMLGHLGHLSIIHAAAWVPWILWALVATRARGWRSAGLGAVAVALCIYGGHPQVAVIGLLFAGLYAVFLAGCELHGAGPGAATRFLLKATVLFAAGLALSAPAIVGLLDSAGNSVRTAWSITDFGSFSHDFPTLRMLWFPNLYGAQPSGPYGPYSGPFNLTELTLYAGTGSWLLGLAGLIAFRRQGSIWFWLFGIVGSLWLALGTATSLGEFVYQLPVLGKFRAQARYGWIFIVSLSVLAAYGVAAIMSQRTGRTQRFLAGGLGLLGLVAVVAWVALDFPAPLRTAADGPWRQPAVLAPLAIMLATLVLFAAWMWRPRYTLAGLMLALLVVDLASFGWYHDWRYLPPGSAIPSGARYAPPPPALTRGNGRVLTQGAQNWPAGTLRPNANIGAGVPVVTGYGPLLTARYAQVTGADPTGGIPRIPRAAPLMDVLGVRWIAGDAVSEEPQLVGNGCGMASPRLSVTFAVPEDVRADQLRVVSHMACSEALADGYTAGTLRVFDAAGAERASLPLQVGRQTGEWAHDRQDLSGVIAHSRPPVAESFEAGGFLGHSYEGRWPIPVGAAARIDITAPANTAAPVKLVKVQVHDATTGQWHTLPLADAGRALTPLPAVAWNGEVPLRERPGYRSMAWVACDARQADLGQTASLLSGKDGSERIDPFRTVLTEQRLILPNACRRRATAEILEKAPGYWRIRTDTDGSGVLVLSSAYHSGWTAEQRRASLSVIAADGILLGVPVGSGRHEITLRFRPPAFISALWLCAATLFGLVLLLIWDWRRQRIRPTSSIERSS